MYHFPEKLALGTLSEFANSVLSKGESVPPLFNGPKCCLLDLIKQNCLQKNVKNYRSVNFLSLSSKVFEKLVNNRLVDYLGKCGLFLISSMVLGLLDLLQIF